MPRRVQFEELCEILARIFQSVGTPQDTAALLAENCAACERDGAKSHGIFRMKGYVDSIRSGWVDPAARPEVEDVAPSFVRVDARNGFAQPALAAARSLAIGKAHQTGACILTLRHSHHLSALWPDIEPFAEAGLIALSVVNSMAVTVPYGAKRPLLGTNPIAFAAPAAGRAPFVFDMATSAWAHGDIQIARREGHPLPEGVGVDADGEPTREPARVLDGGALLPFGGHKGSALSMMIELLGAALTGGQFSSEVDWSGYPSAATPLTGQFILLIDPALSGGSPFTLRASDFMSSLSAAGLKILPGERRRRNRAESLKNGIVLTDEEWEQLIAFAPRPGETANAIVVR